jgi:iron donor protein CyaY
MNDNEFITISEKKLIEIADKIDEIDSQSIFDCDYADGILTIKSFDNGETYVINKHSASQKIWFSSPISGADYFSYKMLEEKWLNDKGQDLTKKLFSEITILLNK